MSEIIKPDNWWEESRSFKKTKVEEYLNIDETLVELEKNSSVIRLEMNSIELPLFSKDPKRIKNLTSSSLELKPGYWRYNFYSS